MCSKILIFTRDEPLNTIVIHTKLYYNYCVVCKFNLYQPNIHVCVLTLFQLVEIIGEDEVIDFIQDLSSEDLQLLQLPGDDEYDPDFNRDDPENQDFKDKEDLIVRNIEHMHVLSDALDHMAGPLVRIATHNQFETFIYIKL